MKIIYRKNYVLLIKVVARVLKPSLFFRRVQKKTLNLTQLSAANVKSERRAAHPQTKKSAPVRLLCYNICQHDTEY